MSIEYIIYWFRRSCIKRKNNLKVAWFLCFIAYSLLWQLNICFITLCLFVHPSIFFSASQFMNVLILVFTLSVTSTMSGIWHNSRWMTWKKRHAIFWHTKLGLLRALQGLDNSWYINIYPHPVWNSKFLY